jgi:heme/copper-type cytochrome/quinol oxidase subunit 4
MELFNIFIGLASVGLMAWTLKVTMAANARIAVPTDARATGARRLSYWPVIGMAILAVAVWIPYFLHLGENKPVNAITMWGNNADGCYIVIDGSVIQQFSSKYYVVMSCGVSNPTTDFLQDTVIATSSTFTIGKSPIAIEAKFTPQLLEEVKAYASLTPPQSPGMWRQAFLIPKNTDLSRIKRMSDVREFGGKLIPTGCEPIE